VLRPLTEVFLRANGYSLIQPLGISLDQVRGDGPGGFSGPYVGTVQTLLVLMAYLAGFALPRRHCSAGKRCPETEWPRTI